jgi:hypothetical protein
MLSAASLRLPRRRSSSRPGVHIERAARNLVRTSLEVASAFRALHDARVTPTSYARLTTALDEFGQFERALQGMSADTRRRLTERGKGLGRTRSLPHGLRVILGGKGSG